MESLPCVFRKLSEEQLQEATARLENYLQTHNYAEKAALESIQKYGVVYKNQVIISLNGLLISEFMGFLSLVTSEALNPSHYFPSVASTLYYATKSRDQDAVSLIAICDAGSILAL